MEFIKDRLAHILRAKNLTASQFAELMEIQPSNVSHLLNGRNKPSLDFLIKLKELFPEYSFDWIILGKKPITEIKFDKDDNESEEQVIEFDNTDVKLPDLEENVFDKVIDNQEKISEKKEIDNILLVYTDKTFDIITPNNK